MALILKGEMYFLNLLLFGVNLNPVLCFKKDLQGMFSPCSSRYPKPSNMSQDEASTKEDSVSRNRRRKKKQRFEILL